ncbi:hypothetical protein [Roseateles sp. P5_E11]
MSNQHSGDLTAAILAAAKSPAGARTDGIPGYSTIQVGRVIQKLCARGELFVAKISHRHARYFNTEAAAKALTVKQATVSIRKRLVPHTAWADVPASNLGEIEPTECPAYEDARFTPDPKDTSWKLFSACQIGEYPSPNSAWAEAAAS